MISIWLANKPPFCDQGLCCSIHVIIVHTETAKGEFYWCIDVVICQSLFAVSAKVINHQMQEHTALMFSNAASVI